MAWNGIMVNDLLLVAYPSDGEVLATYMWASGYSMPDIFTGNTTIKRISSTVTDEKFEIIFHCTNCMSWNNDGTEGEIETSSGQLRLGYAVGYTAPTSSECVTDVSLKQHDDHSLFNANLSSNAANSAYTDWAALATEAVTGDCASPTATATATQTATAVPTATSYDYIVVGGGAGGIPMADRLSEAGHSVLMIEKGPPSTGQWGGDKKPEWLSDTELTRFDVPGLINQIWVDSEGISCTDTDQMAGCVLGGGTSINSGLWWRPSDADWDYNFPEGWKAEDMAGPAEKVFARIPGTVVPSTDDKRYLPQALDLISGGLKDGGWESINALDSPNAKNRTYSPAPFMFNDKAERGGPLNTYLATAMARDNFELWNNTMATRLVREGGHVTGVQVEPFGGLGYNGTVSVTEGTGRVIVSAGTFGSAKLLMRSGIGPKDQLQVVADSDSDKDSMIGEDDWIILPVGHNLEDHVNTDLVAEHDSIIFYDFYGAYDDPIAADKNAYLDNRTGILAQAAPNIGPIAFDEVEGADGITRSIEWTIRTEASLDIESEKAITLSQYLGRGAVSRGRMTLSPSLNTVVSTVPYLHNDDDVEAVITGIENLQKALEGVDGLTWLSPKEGTTAREYVENMAVTTSARGANHWIGSNKMGTDDGREENGTAVVDTDTKVYGVDNLFVVDASIFPGMITVNPSAYIVSVAERASAKILALK